MIELKDKPVLEKKAELEADLKDLKDDLKELKQDLQEINRSKDFVIIKAAKKAFKNYQINRKDTQIDEEKDRIIEEISGYRQEILNKKNIERKDLEDKLKDKRKIKADYIDAFSGFFADISPEEAEEIKKLDFVKEVHPNRQVNVSLYDSVPLINADDVWNLGYTGKNVTIGIIDTGVDYTHADLGGCFLPNLGCKVIGGYDFVNKDANPMDDHGHGTHVAATAAGNGILKGVAPDAKIVAYKVLNAGGSGWWSDVIAAIDRSVDPNQDGNYADHLDVISLSLGGSGNPDDPVSKAIDNAVSNGVVAVIAAGNSGPSSGTIGSPGTARKAITVGAVDKNQVIASFSSRGPVTWSGGTLYKPDVVAPGVSICAAQWQNAWSASQCIDTEHTAISGTSMATPHVSGAAALLLEKYPNLEANEVKSILMQTAIDRGYDIYIQGTGRVDALKSINLPAFVMPNFYEFGINENTAQKSVPFQIEIKKLSSNAYTFTSSVTLNVGSIAASISPSVLNTGANSAAMNFVSSSSNIAEGSYRGVITLTAVEDASINLRLLFNLEVDFTAPVVSNIVTTNQIKENTPEQRVNWNTNEITNSTIYYRKKGALNFQTNTSTGTAHKFKVSGLPLGAYEYYIAAKNKAGAITIENNNGLNYEFTALPATAIPEVGFTKKAAFTQSVDVHTQIPPYDLDGDGKKEFILREGNYYTASTYGVYESTGDNSFTKVHQLPVSGVTYSFLADAGDSDSDGLNEMLMYARVSNPLNARLYESASSSSYPSNLIWSMDFNRYALTAKIDDMDKDVKKELIFALNNEFVPPYTNSPLIAIYENSGNNAYTNVFSVIPSSNPQIQSFTICDDLDGDGKMEFIAGSLGQFDIFENTGDNSYSRIWKGNITARDYNFFKINSENVKCIGDADGDGKKEFIIGGIRVNLFGDNLFYDYYRIFEAVSNDNFKEISEIKFERPGTLSGNSISFGDLDGDGRNEFFITVQSDKTYVFKSTGNDQFGPYWYHKAAVPSTVAIYNANTGAGDFDSDLKGEIIFNEYANGIVNTMLYESDLAYCTSPYISLNAIPNLIGSSIELSAASCSPDGLKSCEVCIANDTICDTEWTSNGVKNSFNGNGTSGICTFVWNSSNYNDGYYAVNMKLTDARDKIAYGIVQSTLLDKTAPKINSVLIPAILQAGSIIKFTANITDNYGVNSASAALNNITSAAQKNNLTNLYEGEIKAPSGFGAYVFDLTASDMIGNTAKKEITIKVEESINWSNDAVLTDDGLSSINPNIAIDSSKNMHIVWEDYRDGNSEIYYNKIDSKNKILIHNKRLTNNLYNSKNPDIAADSFNNAHVVWSDDRDGNKEIYYSKIDSNGGTLTDSKRLTANAFSSEKPLVFADSGNNIHLFWLDNRYSAFNVYYKKFDSNANILAGDKKITTDDIVRFDASFKNNITSLVYQNALNEIFYLRLDNNGNVIINKKAINSGLGPSLALSNFADVVYVDSQNDIEYGKFDFDGNPILNITKITSSGFASNPSIVSDAGNNLHIAWEDSRLGKKELYYTKLDSNGNILVTQSRITVNATNAAMPKITVGSVNIIYQDKAQNNDEIFLKTSSFDATSPVISSVGAADVREFSALITWQTDEPSTSIVNYGAAQSLGSTEKDNKLTRQHNVLLSNLNPSTQYFLEVVSFDMFSNEKIDNNNGFDYTFKTSSTKNRPALPTTFYGLVIYNNGSPASDVLVTATWVDTNNITHNTSVKTLNLNEALALNDTSLLGYFSFNLGNVKAREGSVIKVSAPGDITAPDPFVNANPGGSSVQVAGGPIVLDISPPIITINSPKEIAYLSPFLHLNYTADEEISWAGFKLNEQDIVTVTGMKSKAVNITAKIGENAITVFARDLVGLESSKTIKFFVQDTVAPKVFVNDAKRINKIANLFANVSDATNSLKQSCEVCVSNDGICDTEWVPAVNQFSLGDFAGKCSYSWDTTSISNGIYTLNFRVQDVANNSGAGAAVNVEADNNAPARVAGLLADSVAGKNILNLTWDANTALDFSYYNIYRDSSSFVDVNQKIPIATATKNSYADINLASQQTFYYAVTAADNLGNENKIVSSTSGTVADTVAPVLNLVSPASTMYSKSTIDLIYNANEPLDFCVYSLNKRGNSSVTSDFAADEGANKVDIYCTDLGGNIGHSSVSFTVDTTPPLQINDLKVNTMSKENSLLLQWGMLQNDSISTYNIYRSNAQFTNATSIPLLASTSSNSFKDAGLISGGTYYYAVTAVDNVGNENMKVLSAKGVAADTIAPAVSILSPINKLYKTKLIDLNYTVNEAPQSCWYKLNSGNDIFVGGSSQVTAFEGLNTLTLHCNDTGSNIGSSQISFEADAEVPAQISGLNVGTISKENSLQLSWTASSSTDFAKYSIYRSQSPFNSVDSLTPIASVTTISHKDTGLISEESYYYAITAVDKYSNENKGVLSVKGSVADTSAPKPVANVKAVPSTNEQSVAISWNKNNDNDFSHYNIYRSSSPGILIKTISDKTVTSYKDANLTGGKTYSYTVTAVDNSGNENTTIDSVTVIVTDLEAPIVTLQSPQNIKYNTQSIGLAYTSSEPASCVYSLNNGTNTTATSTITAREGSNAIKLYCTDANGNTGTAQVPFIADTTAPSQVTGLVIIAVSKQNSLNITWNAATASDFSYYKIYRLASPFTDVSAMTPMSTAASAKFADTSVTSESTYYYAVTAVDDAENENKNVASVSGTAADTVAPEQVTGLNVKPIERKNSLNITWNKALAKDLSFYSIYRSAGSFSNIIAATFIANLSKESFEDTGLASSQIYHYAVVALDANGNYNKNVMSASGTVADTIAPNINITSPLNGKTYAKDISLSYSATEPVFSCAYSLNNAPNLTATPTITANEGSNAIKVYCSDSSGNVGGSSPVSFFVDATPPSQVSGLAVMTVPKQTSLNISWNAATASDFSYYKIYRSASSFSDISSMSPLSTTTSNKFTDQLLVSEIAYYYAVTAVDNVGNELKSVVTVSGKVADTVAPAQITGLKVSQVPKENSLNLAWDSSLASDLAYYGIYRSTGPFSDVSTMNLIKNVSTNFHKDANLISGQTYYYAVTAVDGDGNYNRNVVSASGTVSDTIAPNVALISPTNIKYSTKIVNLQYTVNEPAAWCVYSMNNAPNATATPTITANEGDNTIILYCSDTGGNIGATPLISFFIDTVAPSQVTGLAINQIPKKPALNLSWNPSIEPDFDFYRVYRAVSGFSDVSSLTPIAQIKEVSYADINLKSETTYHYAVTAVDTLNNENKNVQSASSTTPDLSAPIITITSPTPVTYNIKNIDVSYKTNEPASWCSYSLNNAANLSINGSASIIADEGLNKLKIYCSDLFENIGSSELNFNVDIKAPDPIAGVSVNSIKGENSLQLSWNPSNATDFSKYSIYRSQSTFNDVSSLTPIASTSANSYKDINLASEGTYYYAVTAVDKYSNENKTVASVKGIAADTTAPAQVSGLNVMRLIGEVGLNTSWSQNNEPDFSHYNIYRLENNFSEISSISPIKTNIIETNFIDVNLNDGTTYFYAITSVDKSGNEDKNIIAKSATTLDYTSPQVLVSNAGNRIAGTAVLSATVSDKGIGLERSCEICLSKDGTCDTEWTAFNILNDFNRGNKNGTCSYSWNTANYLTGTYVYNFRVVDIDNNIGVGMQQQTEIINATGKFQFSIPLYAGWNLISIPLIPEDASTEAVLSSIKGSYSKIYYYNSNTQSWEIFNANRNVFDQPNNLLQLTQGKSYWIEMLNTNTLTISGFEAAGYQSNLAVGWNYIGYPYYGSKNISLALASLEKKYNKVYSYNAELGKWDVHNPYSTTLEPNSITDIGAGKGYLIDISFPTVWKP